MKTERGAMYDGVSGPIIDMVVKATLHQSSAQTLLQRPNRNESNALETPPGPEASSPRYHLSALSGSSAVKQPPIPAPSWPTYAVAPSPVSSPPIPNAPGEPGPDLWQALANSQPALAQRPAQSAVP